MQVNWQGVYPALLTPFTSADQVDIPLFEKNLAAQLDAGVHGLIIGGSLGEASTLRVEEKEILVGFIICKSLGANWSCKKTY